MRFFEAINRWQIVVATLVIIVGIDLGIYSFSHSPNWPPASAPLQGPSVTVPLEDMAPTNVSKTPPASNAQYHP